LYSALLLSLPISSSGWAAFGLGQDVFGVRDQLHGQTRSLGCVGDLHGKEKVADNCQNFLI
jgi:hypothetical protein